MSRQFHTMRKDGTGLTSTGSLGDAMDRMGAGMVMFMGTGEEAVRVAVALGRAERDRKQRWEGVGALLEIGMEGGGSNGNDY